MSAAARRAGCAPRPRAPAPSLLLAALLAAVPALLAPAAARAAGLDDLEARATLTPGELRPDDTAVFTISVRGGVLSRVGFRPDFRLDNFRLAAGPSYSENLSYVNGRASRSLQVSWYLQPLGEGRAGVHSISVEIDGERLDLPAVDARVSRDAPQRSDPNGRPIGGPPGLGRRLRDPLEDLLERYWPEAREEAPEVALHAEVTPHRPYAGQQALYTLWLYTRNPIQGITPDELPDFRGFWVEEIPRAENLSGEPAMLDGQQYMRYPLLQRALFPLRPGSYRIPPASVDLVATLGSASPFRRTLPRGERLHRTGNPLTLDVRPLPPPPADLAGRFTGLVGDLALAADLNPAEVRAGEAATLELRLTGRGNVQVVDTPELPVPDGVEALPPEEKGDLRLRGSSTDSMRVEGLRTWSYPLVAETPGTWRLPPLEMAYFDPQAGEYRLAATEALVLRSRPAAATAGADGRPALHPIHNAALPLPDSRLDRWRRRAGEALPWLFAAPWAVLLTVVLVAAQGRRRDGNPVGGSLRIARRRFAERLRAADRAERPRQAAQEVEDAWRELLGSVAGVAPETPASRWPERLCAAGGAQRSAAALGELVEDLHYLRYAPQLSSIAALRGELVERSRRLARRLGTE